MLIKAYLYSGLLHNAYMLLAAQCGVYLTFLILVNAFQ